MEYRQLGRAGVRVSVIGLGTNRYGTEQLPAPAVATILDAAQELGINFIDASNTYGRGRCEETLGHALKGLWDRFVVSTKGVLPMGDGTNDWGMAPTTVVPRVTTSCRPWMPACAACSMSTSTSITCTAGIAPRPWMRHCAPWMI